MQKTNFIITVFLMAFAMFMMQSGFASERFECQTPNASKSFVLEDGKVSFTEDGKEVFATSGRTPSSNQGKYTQVVNFEGYKHTIHIEDTKKMNEVDDYLWLESKKGHKFLYPIKCNKA